MKFRLLNRGYDQVKPRRRGAMVNTNMVNAVPARAERAVFRKKFPVLGRFLALKNTVNYKRRFELTIFFSLLSFHINGLT
jgi:hypothetical protein